MPVMRMLLTICMMTVVAAADDSANAKALLQQGVELYKAGKYEDAIAALKRSYELDKEPSALYALAQAERLGGHCPDAIKHYKALREATPDATLARAVQNNLEFCEPAKQKECATTEAKSEPGPTKPSSSKLPIALFTGGGVALGAGIGLIIAAGDSQRAAVTAPTYAQYEQNADRAGIERGLGYASVGVAVVGLVAATYVLVKQPSRSTTLSASTSRAGHFVWLQMNW